MSLDLTNFAAMMKTLYSRDKIENLTYKDNPLLAMMAKDENFYGDSKKIPLIYEDSQNRSATFSDAQAGTTNMKSVAFFITRAKDYSIATVDAETMLASQNDAGAFVQALTQAVDSAIHSIVRSLAISMYRNGSGSIGQCNANATSTTLQLKNINDVTNFAVGNELKFSTADGSGSLKSGQVTVTHVNRDSGALTVDALSAIDGGTGVAADDYIFILGDHAAKIKGLQAWVPASAPSSTSFFGVDRSVDVTRLGGIRVDARGMSREEGIIKAITRAAREGASPSHLFVNYSIWNELVLELGSKVQYIDEVVKSGNAVFSFRGVQVNGPKGPVKVVPDQNCPSDYGFLLDLAMWKLESLKQCPHIAEDDTLKVARQSAADGIELRVRYFAQVSCKAPGRNCSIQFN